MILENIVLWFEKRLIISVIFLSGQYQLKQNVSLTEFLKFGIKTAVPVDPGESSLSLVIRRVKVLFEQSYRCYYKLRGTFFSEFNELYT